ncbi:hypothetical protein EAF00_007341 [Botryotinia globosa]|nr:hypothetical protein EAF00_007341 [Botryotinia globosa]
MVNHGQSIKLFAIYWLRYEEYGNPVSYPHQRIIVTFTTTSVTSAAEPFTLALTSFVMINQSRKCLIITYSASPVSPLEIPGVLKEGSYIDDETFAVRGLGRSQMAMGIYKDVGRITSEQVLFAIVVMSEGWTLCSIWKDYRSDILFLAEKCVAIRMDPRPAYNLISTRGRFSGAIRLV